MSHEFIDALSSVKAGKLSEQIADQLRSAILSGLLKPADRLPSERQLVERFEASRNSVREAVKILETLGLLEVRRGSGVFVSGDHTKPMRDSLKSMLKTQQVTVTDLTEARLVLEPAIVRLACEKATRKDMEALEENIGAAAETLKTRSSAYGENIAFHQIIAAATHNPVIETTMDTFFAVLREASVEITGLSRDRFSGSSKAIKFHKRIAALFRQREPQKAYSLMLEHILDIQKDLKKRTLGHGGSGVATEGKRTRQERAGRLSPMGEP
jgi:GntR family transcriptional regulator, transcriptional repressor for pyruvate dehydrogenase complex